MKDKEQVKRELIKALETQIKNVEAEDNLGYVLCNTTISALASTLELNAIKLG